MLSSPFISSKNKQQILQFGLKSSSDTESGLIVDKCKEGGRVKSLMSRVGGFAYVMYLFMLEELFEKCCLVLCSQCAQE